MREKSEKGKVTCTEYTVLPSLPDLSVRLYSHRLASHLGDAGFESLAVELNNIVAARFLTLVVSHRS